MGSELVARSYGSLTPSPDNRGLVLRRAIKDSLRALLDCRYTEWAFGTNSQARTLFLQKSNFSLPGAAQEREERMLHAAFFYVVVITLSIGTVASYLIPMP
jgi:hypothetical protein